MPQEHFFFEENFVNRSTDTFQKISQRISLRQKLNTIKQIKMNILKIPASGNVTFVNQTSLSDSKGLKTATL